MRSETSSASTCSVLTGAAAAVARAGERRAGRRNSGRKRHEAWAMACRRAGRRVQQSLGLRLASGQVPGKARIIAFPVGRLAAAGRYDNSMAIRSRPPTARPCSKPSSSRPPSSPWASSATRRSCWRSCWPRATASPGRSSPGSSSPRWSTMRSPAGSATGCAARCRRRAALAAGAVVLRGGGVGAQARQARRATSAPPARAGACSASRVVAFFLAEIGDKTQIATVMLAAKFASLVGGGARHDARHAARQRARRCSSAARRRRAFRSARCASPPPRCSRRSACGCCWLRLPAWIRRKIRAGIIKGLPQSPA